MLPKVGPVAIALLAALTACRSDHEVDSRTVRCEVSDGTITAVGAVEAPNRAYLVRVTFGYGNKEFGTEQVVRASDDGIVLVSMPVPAGPGGDPRCEITQATLSDGTPAPGAPSLPEAGGVPGVPAP